MCTSWQNGKTKLLQMFVVSSLRMAIEFKVSVIHTFETNFADCGCGNLLFIIFNSTHHRQQ